MKVRAIAILLVIMVSGVFPSSLFAKSLVTGRVFDTDGKTPLADVPVRIVNVDTGEVAEEKTNKDGCYKFKEVVVGSYSLAAANKSQDYLLPEKVNVQQIGGKDAAVVVCVGLPESGNSLILLDECKPCEKFPLIFVLIGGAGAVTAAVIIRNTGDEPVVSESRP